MAKPLSKSIDVLLGLVLFVALVAGLEGALALRGVAPIAEASISRGFDETASYLLPDPELPGAFVTQFQRGGMAPIKIPPRRRMPRVLLFGGSNTAGFPAGQLGFRMTELDPVSPVEVHNLGVPGYGSGRVRILARQALELLEADLAFVYTGHNEFVEAGFQMDVAQIEERTALARFAESTRLYASFSDPKAPKPSPQTRPEAWTWEYEKFVGLTYDQTLEHFELFRANVRAILETARRTKTHAVIGTLVYNRLSAPFSSTPPKGTPPETVARVNSLCAQAREKVPGELRVLLPLLEEDRVHGFDWGTEAKRATFDTLGLVGIRRCAPPLGTPDPDLPVPEGWKPKVRELDGALAKLWAREFDEAERAGLVQAEAAWREALGLIEDHPIALFGLGLVELALGRDVVVAREHLEAAARYDRAPRKASGLVNEIVRSVAAEFPEVLFVDTDGWFREHAPDGIVGWDLMIDHCHMTRGARLALMVHVAEEVDARWPVSVLLAESRARGGE